MNPSHTRRTQRSTGSVQTGPSKRSYVPRAAGLQQRRYEQPASHIAVPRNEPQLSQLTEQTGRSSVFGSQSFVGGSQGHSVPSRRSWASAATPPEVPLRQPSVSASRGSASGMTRTTIHTSGSPRPVSTRPIATQWNNLSTRPSQFGAFGAYAQRPPPQASSYSAAPSMSASHASYMSQQSKPPSYSSEQHQMPSYHSVNSRPAMPPSMPATFYNARPSRAPTPPAASAAPTGTRYHRNSGGNQAPSYSHSANSSVASDTMSPTTKIKALIESFEKTVVHHEKRLHGTAEEQIKKIATSADEQQGLIAETQHQLSNTLKEEAEELSVSANNEHAARVRFYGKKSEQLDGQVAEATKSIKSEEKAAVQSIKKVYGTVATKLRDVGTDLANGLLNHPVADTIKTFWAQVRQHKETPQKTHPVETSSKMDAGTLASPSAKTVRSASSKKSSRSSKHSRIALSPLQMVANLPRSAQKKRMSDDTASPVSKRSYVTPSQAAKRRKSVVPSPRFSVASARAGSSRGRFGKARSAFSQNSFSSQMADDNCAFLSQY